MTTFLTLGLLSGKCSHGANMTISVERHGEMRQGLTSESKFDSKRRRRKTGFFLSCRVNYEISFSLKANSDYLFKK